MEKSEKATQIYQIFKDISISELESVLASDASREEKLFCRAMINLKLQMTQEKIVGEILL